METSVCSVCSVVERSRKHEDTKFEQVLLTTEITGRSLSVVSVYSVVDRDFVLSWTDSRNGILRDIRSRATLKANKVPG
jgi:hypothetical protein